MTDFYKFLKGSLVGAAVLLVVCNLIGYDATTHPINVRLVDSPQSSIYMYKEPTMEEQIVLCNQTPECKLLAEAIFFEGRGESVAGQYAIAFAVVNRRDDWRWPDTIKGVINQRIHGTCQFSYICQISRTMQSKMMVKENESLTTALNIAYNVYHFKVEDPTNGADHYYNPRKVAKPKFAKVYAFADSIGAHQFYRSTIQ